MAETTLHGVFIGVEVDPSVRDDAALAAKLSEVCPVDIYAVGPDGGVAVVDPDDAPPERALQLLARALGLGKLGHARPAAAGAPRR